MTQQLWGCYAVNEHLRKRAFVADVLLFERLVIPVPPEDDPKALLPWKRWDGHKQKKLLEILGGIAYPVPWSTRLRDRFAATWSALYAAQEVDAQAEAGRYALEAGISPQDAAMTRLVLSQELTNRVLNQPDVLALAAYASEVEFEKDWYFSRSWPFLASHAQAVPDQPEYEIDSAMPADDYGTAMLLVGRFAIPENPRRSDQDMLKEAVDLASQREMVDWRRSYHGWIADMARRDLSDQTVVREMGELIAAYNAAATRKKRATAVRLSANLVGSGVATGAAIWTGPLGIAAAAPFAAVGDVVAKRVEGKVPAERIAAGALLAEAAKVFR